MNLLMWALFIIGVLMVGSTGWGFVPISIAVSFWLAG